MLFPSATDFTKHSVEQGGGEEKWREKKRESMNMHARVRTEMHQEKGMHRQQTTAATAATAGDVPDQIRQHVQPKQLIFAFHVLRRIGLHIVQPFVPRFLKWARKWARKWVGKWVRKWVGKWATSMVLYTIKHHRF